MRRCHDAMQSLAARRDRRARTDAASSCTTSTGVAQRWRRGCGAEPDLTLMAANWPEPPLCFLCVYWMSAMRLMDSR